MTASQTIEPPVMRLPWAATVASLISFVALFISERGSVILPILALVLLASYWYSFRLEAKPGLKWIVRIVLWGIILTLTLLRQGQANDLNDAQHMGWIGEMFAVELVVQAWRNRPEGGHGGVVTILLSGLVFGNACNAYEGEVNYIRYLTPLYVLFLALALRQFRPAAAKPVSQSFRNQGPWFLLLTLALTLGFVNYYLFHYFRAELTNWGMQLLHEMPIRTSGMSWNPTLGPTFGQRNSDERVLQIMGDSGDLSHLRGLAFDTYHEGKWGPYRQYRTLVSVTSRAIPTAGKGISLRVTRLVPNEGMLFVPLNISSLDTADGSEMRWSPDSSSPVVGNSSVPSEYTFTLPEGDYQGPLCAAPNDEERQRLLAVPPEIAQGVRDLAQKIGGFLPNPRLRVDAVQAYLMANNAYSLRTNPGRGDPVSNFILQKKAAHCEYFASAAVIMSRCLGVPARYVTGYVGHETDPSGATVVRQRDAHAWAECWIEGKGWITLDATPGDGRPDENPKPIASWTRFREWLQDSMRRLGGLVSGSKGMALVLVLPAGALLVLLWQWRRQTRVPKPPKAGVFTYTASQAELTTLFSQFEAVCRKQGLVCPSGQTWQEYLSRLAPEALPAGFDREQALSFVHTYNAARFGLASLEDMARLQEMLPQEEASSPRKPT